MMASIMTKDFALMEKGVILEDDKPEIRSDEPRVTQTPFHLHPVPRLSEAEEKVPLEMCRNGSLIISPSVATELCRMTGDESQYCDTSQLKGKVNWEKIVGRKSSARKAINRTGWRKYGGIIFGLSASFFASLSLALVRLLNAYDPLSLAVWRYCGGTVPAAILLLCLKIRNGKSERVFESILPLRDKGKLLNFFGILLRSLLGCTSVLFQWYSLKYLTLADATVISYCSPVFVVILAHFFLGEKCGLTAVFVAGLTAIGLFVIARPPLLTGAKGFDSETLIGTALALSSMICTSSAAILMRRIRKVHYGLMLLIMGIWGILESTIVASSFTGLQLPTTVLDAILSLLVLPALVFCGTLSLIFALQYEKEYAVTIVLCCELIFACIWQGIFFNVIPDRFSVVGSAIVVIGVGFSSWQQFLQALPTEDKLRQKWMCLIHS